VVDAEEEGDKTCSGACSTSIKVGRSAASESCGVVELEKEGGGEAETVSGRELTTGKLGAGVIAKKRRASLQNRAHDTHASRGCKAMASASCSRITFTTA